MALVRLAGGISHELFDGRALVAVKLVRCEQDAARGSTPAGGDHRQRAVVRTPSKM